MTTKLTRFDEVILVSIRTKELMQGAQPKVPVIGFEKPIITAIREVKSHAFTMQDLKKILEKIRTKADEAV
jgi:DNA-directed RNA polymerase subunit K/omega